MQWNFNLERYEQVIEENVSEGEGTWYNTESN